MKSDRYLTTTEKGRRIEHVQNLAKELRREKPEVAVKEGIGRLLPVQPLLRVELVEEVEEDRDAVRGRGEAAERHQNRLHGAKSRSAMRYRRLLKLVFQESSSGLFFIHK